MEYQLSDICLSDVEILIRQCEFPAMRNDPLRKIMFLNEETNTQGENEEIIRWTAEGLQESLKKELCYFRKVTSSSGSYVGFAIWTLEASSEITRPRAMLDKRRESWNPVSLDVGAWLEVSKNLREERLRILHGKRNIWSKPPSIPVPR